MLISPKSWSRLLRAVTRVVPTALALAAGLGGLQAGLLEAARAAGAQGVALMRAAWD
jgi:thiamine monophosphate synthase